MDEKDLLWLAGLLDGEGSFIHGPPSAPRRPQIHIMMTDEDVIRRVAVLFGVTYRLVGSPSRGQQYRPIWHAQKRGSAAVSLMLELLPHLGARRSARILDIVQRYLQMKATLRGHKLGRQKALQIRGRWLAGELNESKLAREYGVSANTVWKIVNGWIHKAA